MQEHRIGRTFFLNVFKIGYPLAMARTRPLHPPSPGEPDMEVLGVLSLGLAIASLLLALSYLLTPLAYLAGAVALPFGLMSRGHERSDTLGTIAVAVTAVALLLATAILVVAFT